MNEPDIAWMKRNPAAARVGIRSKAENEWIWRHPSYEADTLEEYTEAWKKGLRPLDSHLDLEES